MRQPAGVVDDAVELVAVDDQIAPPVGRLVDRLAGHPHAAEMLAAEVSQPVVVIAGNIDDPHAALRQRQHLLHHVGVGLRPVPAAFQPPAVHDVADQIQRLAVHLVQEVAQQLRLAAPRAEVDVRDEGGPAARHVLAPVRPGYAAIPCRLHDVEALGSFEKYLRQRNAHWHGLFAAEAVAAGVGLLGIAVTLTMLPETEGKSLEELNPDVQAPSQGQPALA